MSGYRQFKRGKTHAFGFSDWDEEKHPRDGGKFAPKEGEGGREGAHAVAESVNLEGVPEKIQADIMNQAATLQREYGVPPLDEIEVGKAHEGHSGALSFVLDLDTTPPGKRLVIDKDFLARLEGEGVTLDEWALGRSDLQSGSASDLIAHEMAHYYSEGVFRMSRRSAETIAESVAFTVGAHFGFDTGTRSFPYVALWAEDKKVLEQNLADIRKVSTNIINALASATGELTLARRV